MKKLFIAFAFAAFCASAQLAAPSLEQIKIAADAGDPVAQDKLAEQFMMRADVADAENWYRKSAEQGYAHAQGQLGNMLLMHWRSTIGLKPDAHAAIGDEAVKWITLAANQGDTQGEETLAGLCLEGKLVKLDLIEAYKWGDLAAQKNLFSSAKNSAILKMNAEQIAEAQKRVSEFVPHQAQKSDLQEPAWVQKIKVSSISGTPDRRFALINNETFAKGDQATVKVGDKRVMIHCIEVRESSVIVSIEGIDGTRELKLQ
jgi:TPR repeat protein